MPTTPVTGKNYPAQKALIGRTLVLQSKLSNRDETSPGRIEIPIRLLGAGYPSIRLCRDEDHDTYIYFGSWPHTSASDISVALPSKIQIHK